MLMTANLLLVLAAMGQHYTTTSPLCLPTDVTKWPLLLLPLKTEWSTSRYVLVNLFSASQIWWLQNNTNFLHYDSRCSQIAGISHKTIKLSISGCRTYFWVSVLMQFFISQSLQLQILQTAMHLPSSIVSPTDSVAQPTCTSSGHRFQ
jgi:hypothetical protein